MRDRVEHAERWERLPARGLVSPPQLVCDQRQGGQGHRREDDLRSRSERWLQVQVRFVTAGSAIAVIRYSDVVLGDAIEVATDGAL